MRILHYRDDNSGARAPVPPVGDVVESRVLHALPPKAACLSAVEDVGLRSTCTPLVHTQYGRPCVHASPKYYDQKGVNITPGESSGSSRRLGLAQDPLAAGNQANVIMLDTRKRKGLKPEPAPLNEYEDKL